MDHFDGARHVGSTQALAHLPGPGGQRFREVFRHGSLPVEIYAPQGHDSQTAHDRDEIYVVIAGRGVFVVGGRRCAFAVGDFLFAPARVPHRFDEFTAELAVWVFFYGPRGGESGRRPT